MKNYYIYFGTYHNLINAKGLKEVIEDVLEFNLVLITENGIYKVRSQNSIKKDIAENLASIIKFAYNIDCYAAP